MVRYLAFLSDLSGQPVAVTPELHQTIRSDMLRRFYTMPPQQKQILCSASLIWALLESNWKRLTGDQREQFRRNYHARTAGMQPAAGGAGPVATTGRPDTGKSMAEFQARQNMLRIMSDMNLQTHATSLNIIENIGGTGNYWEVVDY